jgi:glycine oxidase
MTACSSDILIIGGGVIGALAARRLARTGMTVTVLDRARSDQQSSWAGAGLLSALPPWSGPGPVLDLAEPSARAYPELCRDLHEVTGVDPELEQRGVLWLDPQISASAADLERHGACWLAPEAAAAVLPGVRRCQRALHLSRTATVRNPRLMQALRADLARSGVAQVAGEAVSLMRADGLWRVRLADDSQRCAPQVLLAAGAWTSGLLSTLGYQLPVRPVRGQILLLRAAQPLAGPVVLEDDRYVVPRRDGHLLVGSTVEEVGFEAGTTASALDELRQTFSHLLPGVDAIEVGAWAGLRPGSPQGIPFIGPVPGQEALFVCAGHYRMGLTLAPASADLICELIHGASPSPAYALPAAA